MAGSSKAAARSWRWSSKRRVTGLSRRSWPPRPEPMIDLKSETHSLIRNFELMKELLATYGPDSFQVLRERAFRSYTEFGIPTTKDEEFKYLSLRVLEEGHFK